jgi:hypothetical protein
MWSWGQCMEIWCRVGLGYIREPHGCGSLETVEIYTWVCNKDIGKIKSPLDSLFGK